MSSEDAYADVGLGKGAWCCDTRSEIAPEDEAAVFEEIPTFAWTFPHLKDVPTVSARTNTTHVAAWFDGCRYRVEFDVEGGGTVGALRQKLFDGGMGRGDEMSTGARRKVDDAEDIVMMYAGKRMLDLDAPLREYGVPVGCKILLAIPRALLERAERGLGPAPEDDYWA
jgi:hypothetical protein